MPELTDRIMRGQYVAKRDCYDESVARLMDCYPAAMRAMEEHERMMRDCICTIEGGYGDAGDQVVRKPTRGCIVHAEEDSEGKSDGR